MDISRGVSSEDMTLLGVSWIRAEFNQQYKNYYYAKVFQMPEAPICKASYDVTKEGDDYVCPDTSGASPQQYKHMSVVFVTLFTFVFSKLVL